MSLLLEHALNFTKIPGICAARMHLKKFSYFNGKAVLESHFSVSTADSSISWYNERSSSVSLLSGFEVCFFFFFKLSIEKVTCSYLYNGPFTSEKLEITGKNRNTYF